MALTHLAFILDGNRRWAKARGLPTFEGHRRGYDNLKTIGLAALERGVTHVSAFVFSTENWNRSAEEVSYLMDLLYKAIADEIGFFMEHDIRLKVIGSRDRLSEKLQAAIANAEAKTAGNGRGQMNLCLNYGGRAEIVEAAKAVIASGARPEDVTEELLASKMWTAGVPDPDLIVRTSGENRLSGFLTWSGVYSELLFVDKHWPDFDAGDLDAAIEEYGRRERRYGK
ncbi:MAG TPA: polyprenyl diphosphate synthase, partial [Candidatus Eisenbacteria bacterium]|nr:polyprenyl diphosphate synthase [Candidatus Eisenbacteria bacterium]